MDFIIILCAHLNINNKKKEINIETYINLKKKFKYTVIRLQHLPIFHTKIGKEVK